MLQWVVVGLLCNQLLESSVTGHLLVICPISVLIGQEEDVGLLPHPSLSMFMLEGAAFI